ncbi:fumarylacetoacetate hydrolase family protein [Thermodesulfobacteriota bacterium]
MKIIRFIDEQDHICYGHNYTGETAVLLEGALFGELQDTGPQVRVKKILAPLDPRALLCIGLNYHEHAGETGFELPKYPILFMKNPAALAHPGDPIVIPTCCTKAPEVDYEVELAVVIGKAAKNVSSAEALQYILGYTPANDVSARRWQFHAGERQWDRGKSFDTFCPLGPEIITADEIPDPQTLQIKCILNGETMQDANTSDMIFSVAEIIAYLSTDMTLLPGTVILTGTPSGVGFTRKPPVYMMPGDTVEILIDGFRPLISPVVEEKIKPE